MKKGGQNTDGTFCEYVVRSKRLEDSQARMLRCSSVKVSYVNHVTPIPDGLSSEAGCGHYVRGA